jgi:acyl transferase domain-containing protein
LLIKTKSIVGGVSLILAPEVNMNQLSTLGFLSPDGRSYSFDSRANGYAKGEGVCVVVLKRLSDAIRDNDTIRGVIRATTVNQDGRTPGITQPSKRAQTENIQRAYEEANLDVNDTHYFEAHGTGTAVGDPLEAEAIHNAFQRSPERPLWIGALKANIGHLEAAAGVASLIKAVLVLEKGILPPNADFRVPNPNIPIDKYNFKVNRLPFQPVFVFVWTGLI